VLFWAATAIIVLFCGILGQCFGQLQLQLPMWLGEQQAFLKFLANYLVFS
jgi:hypothetical protein